MAKKRNKNHKKQKASVENSCLVISQADCLNIEQENGKNITQPVQEIITSEEKLTLLKDCAAETAVSSIKKSFTLKNHLFEAWALAAAFVIFLCMAEPAQTSVSVSASTKDFSEKDKYVSITKLKQEYTQKKAVKPAKTIDTESLLAAQNIPAFSDETRGIIEIPLNLNYFGNEQSVSAGSQTSKPISLKQSKKFNLNEQIVLKSRKYNVDEHLIRAVIFAESSNSHSKVSRRGAIGYMQLMPSTAKYLGVNPRDPSQNLDGGIRYLKKLINNFDGNVSLALAAYNAGPYNVKKYNGIPPFRATQSYVKKIMKEYSKSKQK